MTLRDIVFPVWAANGQTQARTVTALLAIAAGQVVVVERGGRRLAAASVGGENYNFEIPYGLGPLDVLAQVREAWAVIRSFDDAELETWLTQRETIGALVSFSAIAQ